jgi:hypothetical protein
MSDQYVQVSPDSSGKKIDVSELTVSNNTVERQRVVIGGNASNVALVEVTNADPGSSDYALPVRNIPSGTQGVSAASLPLPSGASTAAKQPALGTAGSASADVISVQGVASMTSLKVDGSAVTQPVSGTFYQATQPVSAAALPLPSGAATESTLSSLNTKVTAVNTGAVVVSSSALPSGAATAAKQPALGTAGSASADVITVQGAASMTAIKTDGSGVTQPVSFSSTVTTQGLGTAGTPSGGINTIQGVDSMHPVKICGNDNNAVPSASDHSLIVASQGYVSSLSASGGNPLGTGIQDQAGRNIFLVGTNTGHVISEGAGTAGTASGGVLSVQGVASMTALKVDGSAVTQPVSASSLPLPSGAATESTLSTLNSKVTAVNTGAVVVSSSALPSGAATAVKQPALGTAGSSSTDVISVQGIASGTAMLIGHVDTAPATQNITAADAVSATATGQNSQSIITGTPTANSAASFAISGLETVSFQITGTWVATLLTEVSFDSGTTWYTRGGHLSGTNFAVASFTSNAEGFLNAAAITNFRVRCSAYTSGTAVVRIAASLNPSSTYIVNGIKLSDGTTPSQQLAIGTTGAASTNISQLAGTTADTNSGSKSAGTLRVVLATDQPALTNKLLVTPDANSAINVAQVNGTTTDTNSGTKSAGTIRVVLATDQPALTNKLLVTPDALSTVVASGDVASGSSDSGNPVKIGALARTTPPTAVSTAQRVNLTASTWGEQLAISTLRELKGNQQTTITSSTGETTIVTADATYKLDLYGLILTNSSTTYTKVTIKDATSGTTRAVISVPGQETRGFMLPPDAGHKQSAANANWTATCGTSVASIDITALFIQHL